MIFITNQQEAHFALINIYSYEIMEKGIAHTYVDAWRSVLQSSGIADGWM